MKIIVDCFGREVRLTDERLSHILEHPELRNMEAELVRVTGQPQLVRRSCSGSAVHLFYGFYSQTAVSCKWLCVVFKYEKADDFVVIVYLSISLMREKNYGG